MEPAVLAAAISAGTVVFVASGSGLIKLYLDRPRVRVVGERYWPERDALMIRVSVRNSGRRPIDIHETGVLLERNGYQRRIEAGPVADLPVRLHEGEAARFYVLWDELGPEFARGNGAITGVYADAPGKSLITGPYEGPVQETP